MVSEHRFAGYVYYALWRQMGDHCLEEGASQLIWQECALWKVLRAQSCWCAQLGTLEANLGRNDRAYTRDVGSLPIAAGIIIVLS